MAVEIVAAMHSESNDTYGTRFARLHRSNRAPLWRVRFPSQSQFLIVGNKLRQRGASFSIGGACRKKALHRHRRAARYLPIVPQPRNRHLLPHHLHPLIGDATPFNRNPIPQLIPFLHCPPHSRNNNCANLLKYTCQFGQLCPAPDSFHTCRTFFPSNKSCSFFIPANAKSSRPHPSHTNFNF